MLEYIACLIIHVMVAMVEVVQVEQMIQGTMR